MGGHRLLKILEGLNGQSKDFTMVFKNGVCGVGGARAPNAKTTGCLCRQCMKVRIRMDMK